jgi:hypothetical protein
VVVITKGRFHEDAEPAAHENLNDKQQQQESQG